MDRIVRRVATLDLPNALLQGHGLACRSGGHVSEGERVEDRPILDREGNQLIEQPTFLSLEPCSRVVRDQAGQPLVTVPSEEPGAVDGMEAKPIQRRRVADVMHVGGGHQHLTILIREGHAHAAGLAGDRLDVQPPVAQRGHQVLGLRLRPWFQCHGATIPCPLDRAQAVLLAASMLVRSWVMVDGAHSSGRRNCLGESARIR